MTRAVLVTGAAGGIGRTICARLAADGWHVVPADRAWSEPVDGAVTADLADPEQVERIIAEAPPLTAIVNNAATMATGPALDVPITTWDEVFAVNVRAAFALVKHSGPALRERRGAVVNVSSVHALATSPGAAAYAASKAALSGLTRSLALELGPSGIRVNAVLPGAVDTAMLQMGLNRVTDSAAARARLIERTPLRRVGSPDDIAHAVAFLLDDERSGFITGQQLVVDGGATARLGTE